MTMNFVGGILVLITTCAPAIATSASAGKESHSSAEQVVIVSFSKIVQYENGMTLVLERPLSNGENCFHLENAASFSAQQLEKLTLAVEKNRPVKVKVKDGIVLEVY